MTYRPILMYAHTAQSVCPLRVNSPLITFCGFLSAHT